MPIESSARAALLATVLGSGPLPESIVERQIKVPAIRLVVPSQRPPLDLDAVIFRYRILVDGTITVVDEPAGARRCRGTHRRFSKRA